MQTVVETPPYLVDAERLFSAVERAAIVDRLASDPKCGVVVPAPVVFARYGSASGRAERVVAPELFISISGENLPVFILAAFAKNEKADLSAAERNKLARVVDEMIKAYRRHK
jgi:hypothetical protein